jgi:hypothetical protein
MKNLENTTELIEIIKNIIENNHESLKMVQNIIVLIIIINCTIIILDTFILCSSKTSFLGPGEKNILNKHNLDHPTQEKQDDVIIPLRMFWTRRSGLLMQGQIGSFIMYEINDWNSSTIVSVTPPYRRVRAQFGVPNCLRNGIHLETLRLDGTYTSPNWAMNANRRGVWCQGLRHLGVKYVDRYGRDIIYLGSMMYIPS